MVDVTEITPEQVQHILNIEESHYLDVKAIEVAPSKLTETISAFANASGGEVFLGVDEEVRGNEKIRSWRGFNDIEAANAHLQVIEAMKPLGGHYNASFLKCLSVQGLTLHIEIPKSKDIIKASNGNPYVRKGAQKLPVISLEAMRRLELDKGIISFEDERVNASIESVTNSVAVIDFMLGVIPSADPEAWLLKQALIASGRPTVAGVMLFHDEPQSALPKRSAIKIYRYKSRAEEGTRDQLAADPITVEGCAYDLIYGICSTRVKDGLA